MRRKLFASLCALALISSCSLLFSNGNQSKNVRYYVLNSVSQKTGFKTPLNCKVRIRDFTIAEIYKQSEIVYRKSRNEMNYYNLELWAAKPEYLVADMMLRNYRAANLFQSITRSVVSEEVEYYLDGEISAIEELDSADQRYAHFAIILQLYHSNTNEEVWKRSWDVREIVESETPSAVVAGISHILNIIGDESSVDLYQVLQNHK